MKGTTRIPQKAMSRAPGKVHSILDITQKHNSVKTVTVDVVVILNFCTLSDDALIEAKI